MRIIAATRLSVLDDSTASPERQAENLREYAKRNGHTVVAETSDLDVSGGKPIRKRPGVGAWLTPEHLDEWDAIAGYALDRMFRNLYDFVTFWHDFLEPNGKSLIITSENIDMSTPDGVMMAQMRVMMAENELNKIRKRNKDASDWARRMGFWKGGQVPWGYVPVRSGENGDGPHWVLVPDPELKELINQIADDLISGAASRADICRMLTERRVPTGRRAKDGEPRTMWKTGPLTTLLRKETLKGYITCNHKLVKRDGKRAVTYDLVRNEDGTPMRREPILSDAKWAALQAAIKVNPGAATGKRRDASLLLRVAECASCDGPMHHHGFTSTKRGVTYSYAYYFCYDRDRCGEKHVKAAELERWLNTWMTKGPFADKYMIERTAPRIRGFHEEIAQVDFRLANLDQDADDYDDQHAELRHERKRLVKAAEEEKANTPAPQDRVTDIKLRDYWPTLTLAQKRAHMLRAGLVVKVRNNPDASDPLDVWVEGDPTRVEGALIRKRAA